MNETELITSRFIEQAEYIDRDDFSAWSAAHPQEKIIIKKLCSPGAKLITGPRGCGKTTLLLKSYYSMLANGKAAFPIYANFKTSLKIEPLYHNNSNAKYWFNQWLILKVLIGALDALDELGVSADELNIPSKEKLERAKFELEMGTFDTAQLNESTADSSYLKSIIGEIMRKTGKKRCILLLDDAAHAFSAEQQRDFFDFFRQIKSREISPKAAIYPGVTVYSSSFHVGHDAEEIDVWVRPDSENYTTFMRQLLKRRLDTASFAAFSSSPELLDLLCYAAFGIPRNLLNSARSLLESEEGGEKVNPTKITRKNVLANVKESTANSLSVYLSLKIKLPIYKNFIDEGEKILRRSVDAIKEYNKEKPSNRKSVDLAVANPIPNPLEKTLAFMEYAGLISPKGKVSRGEKGTFQLYTIHYGILIDNNAMLATRSQNLTDLVTSLKARNAHEFTRLSTLKLLGKSDIDALFSLSLPPCEVCNSERTNEEAKFCMNCGSKLKTASTFDSIVNQDIDNLPLTAHRVSKIKNNSSIRKIKDVLMDQGQNRLRKVPMIGPVWAKKIFSYAEEFIA